MLKKKKDCKKTEDHVLQNIRSNRERIWDDIALVGREKVENL